MRLLFIILISTYSFFGAASEGVKEKRKNIILVALDALQAKHVGAYGYKRDTTPFFDELSHRGRVFENAISPSSWTVPTYLSIFSSTYPSDHGMTNRYKKFTKTEKILNNFSKLDPSLKPIAQILKEKGYRTAGFTGDAGVAAVLGYNLGFEVYTDETQFGGLDNSLSKSNEWLNSLKPSENFFLFLHGYDCHGQYKIKENYEGKFFSKKLKTRFKGTPAEQAQLREAALAGKPEKLSKDDMQFWKNWYDSKIYDADSRLKDIYQDLEKRHLLENSIVVVFSDHGTEFFDHGGIDHGHTLYDELIRVPLLVIDPEIKAGPIVHEQVTTLDILPTGLELANLETTPELKKQIKGISLVPVLKGDAPAARDLFSETDLRNYTHKRAIRTSDQWKYIMTLESGKDELYNLKKDPDEKKNLVLSETKKAKEIREKLLVHLNSLKNLQGEAGSECLPVYKGQCE